MEILRNKGFEDWLKSKNIPTKSSKIYFIDNKKDLRILGQKGGKYVPHKYEGYIRFVNDTGLFYERYIHETAHGVFFENFAIGRRIVDLEKAYIDLRKQAMIKTNSGKKTLIPSEYIKKPVIKKDNIILPQNLFNKITLVDKKLKQTYKYNYKLIEGFSILTFASRQLKAR